MAENSTIWYPVSEKLPPEGVLVDVITESGDKRQLRLSKNLWFLPDMSMYVYFSVKSWSLAKEEPELTLTELRRRAQLALGIYEQWAMSIDGGTTTNEDLMASVIEGLLKKTEELESTISEVRSVAYGASGHHRTSLPGSALTEIREIADRALSS